MSDQRLAFSQERLREVELRENRAALRVRWVIVWMFLALLGGTLCFIAGWFAGGVG
jgi:membrane protein YqaA with SNARE-associated domain